MATIDALRVYAWARRTIELCYVPLERPVCSTPLIMRGISVIRGTGIAR